MAKYLLITSGSGGPFAVCSLPKGYLKQPGDAGYLREQLEAAVVGASVAYGTDSQVHAGAWYLKVYDGPMAAIREWLTAHGFINSPVSAEERQADEAKRRGAWGLVAYADR